MANNSKFSVGQMVKLKSGGPDMTIERVIGASPTLGRPTEVYRCQWFAGKKLDHGDFPPESLVAVQPAANNA